MLAQTANATKLKPAQIRFERLAGLVEVRRRDRPATVFIASEQGIDVGQYRYAVVCDRHHTICGAATRADARVLFESLEFCEECCAKSGA